MCNDRMASFEPREKGDLIGYRAKEKAEIDKKGENR
jgi:hypothetical protein